MFWFRACASRFRTFTFQGSPKGRLQGIRFRFFHVSSKGRLWGVGFRTLVEICRTLESLIILSCLYRV